MAPTQPTPETITATLTERVWEPLPLKRRMVVGLSCNAIPGPVPKGREDRNHPISARLFLYQVSPPLPPVLRYQRPNVISASQREPACT